MKGPISTNLVEALAWATDRTTRERGTSGYGRQTPQDELASVLGSEIEKKSRERGISGTEDILGGRAHGEEIGWINPPKKGSEEYIGFL